AVLRSTFEWPHQVLRGAVMPRRARVEEDSSDPAGTGSEGSLHDWPNETTSDVTRSTPMWEAAATAPVRTTNTIPARTPVRAHQLPNLTTPSTKTSSDLEPSRDPHQFSEACPTSSEAQLNDEAVPAAVPRRDWIYEIATALAEECDLRGLDA